MLSKLRLRSFSASKVALKGICVRTVPVPATNDATKLRRFQARSDDSGESARTKLHTDSRQSDLDFGYLWTDEDWIYLTIVLDLFNRKVIRYSFEPRMTTDIVTDSLTMTRFRRWPNAGAMYHSDRDNQYASHAFQDKHKEFGMAGSMSRKGNCWYNAPTESWFNSFKDERYHGVRYAIHIEMKAASFEYMAAFYNRTQ